METISFYSYKGGVGRTLALANVANYLLKMNLRVCVLDFDLEAPGLHYKLSEQQKIEPKKGIVDIIHDYYINRNEKFEIKEFAIPILQKENNGTLFFIPAGNITANEYWRKLSAINWTDLLYSEGRYGIYFFQYIKDLIKDELKPDYLLIDSRTGVTEIGGICTTLLADKILFLLTNNQENIDGTNSVSKAVAIAPRLKGLNPIEKYYALTRIPQDLADNRIKKIAEQIDDNNFTSRLIKIYSDRELERIENLKLGKSKIDETELTKNYIDLFTKIIGIENVEKHIVTLIESISNEKSEVAIAGLESLSKSILNTQIDEKLLDVCLKSKNEIKFVENYKAYYNKINKGVDTKYINEYINFFIETKSTKIYDLEIINNYTEKSINQNVSRTLYYLGKAYLAEKIYDGANKAFAKLLEKKYELPKVLNNLFIIYRQIKDDTIAQLFRQYETDIFADDKLLLEYCEYIYEKKDTETLSKIINYKEFRTYLIESNPILSFYVFSDLYNTKAVLGPYNDLIDKYIQNSEINTLKYIAIIYSQFPEKEKEFTAKLNNHKQSVKLFQEISELKSRTKFNKGKIEIEIKESPPKFKRFNTDYEL